MTTHTTDQRGAQTTKPRHDWEPEIFKVGTFYAHISSSVSLTTGKVTGWQFAIRQGEKYKSPLVIKSKQKEFRTKAAAKRAAIAAAQVAK